MITKIKDALYNNEDKLKDILEVLEFEKIRKMGNCLKFSWGDGGASSGVANSLNIETLKFDSYSKNIHGDLLSLVSERQGVELGSAIKWLANYLGLNWSYTPKQEVHLPFNAFFLNYEKVQEENEINTLVYSINELDKYQKGSTTLWIEDNIDCQTQEYFNICYDGYSNRILTPWITLEGELGGLTGRINERELKDGVLKYVSMIPMNKSMMLFGLYQHYNEIQEQGVCFVFEAEKSTMQLHSYGIKTGVSLGCKTITHKQVSLLKSLCVDIILCLDSDVDEEYIKEECNKLKVSNPFFTNKVGYIHDREEKYLKKEDKVSPTDLGYETFCKVLGGCLYWIE